MNNHTGMIKGDLRKSLNLILIAANFAFIFGIITGGPALTGFTRALGANDFIYGIIMAMPVIGAVSQIFISFLLENTGRRKQIFLVSGFIARLLWIPIALVPVFFPLNQGMTAIWLVIVLMAMSSAAGSALGVAFYSWLGSLVPSEIRGRYFTKRTMVYTITVAMVSISSGRFLDLVPGLRGYIILFIVASVAGLCDVILFFWVKDPPMPPPEARIPLSRLVLEPFGNRNYIRYILFVTTWSFSIYISAPFFNLYMIENLKMSFLIIMLVSQVIQNFATIASITFWGRLIDRFGNKPVMKICCVSMLLMPVLWYFVSPENYLLTLVFFFLAGIFWPGYDTSAVNLSIWLAPEKNRSIYIANYTTIVNLAGIVLAYICGGAFMEYGHKLLDGHRIPFFMGEALNPFHLLFTLSIVLRILSVLFFFRLFKEEGAKTASEALSHLGRIILRKTTSAEG